MGQLSTIEQPGFSTTATTCRGGRLKLARRAVCLLLLAGLVGQAQGATVRLERRGEEQFHLVGDGLSDVAALDVVVRYQPEALLLKNATVGELLSGTMVVINSRTPGEVRLAGILLPPKSGSGTLAVLEGRLSDPRRWPFSDLSVQLRDPRNALLPVSSSATPDTDTPAIARFGGTSAAVATATPGAPGHTFATKLVPPDSLPPEEPSDAPPEIFSPRPAAALPAVVSSATGHYGSGGGSAGSTARLVRPSIIDRQCASGTPGANVSAAAGVRQLPAVAVSTGKASVVIRLPKRGTISASAVSNGRLLRLGPGPQNSWELEILPAADSDETRLFLVGPGLDVAIALDLLPPAVATLPVPTAPFDLDGDGSNDCRERGYAELLRQRSRPAPAPIPVAEPGAAP